MITALILTAVIWAPVSLAIALVLGHLVGRGEPGEATDLVAVHRADGSDTFAGGQP